MNLAISLKTALTGAVAQATVVTNNEVTNPALVNKYQGCCLRKILGSPSGS